MYSNHRNNVFITQHNISNEWSVMSCGFENYQFSGEIYVPSPGVKSPLVDLISNLLISCTFSYKECILHRGKLGLKQSQDRLIH
jgi:hypothetical protein